jgi:hypothetical protein
MPMGAGSPEPLHGFTAGASTDHLVIGLQTLHVGGCAEEVVRADSITVLANARVTGVNDIARHEQVKIIAYVIDVARVLALGVCSKPTSAPATVRPIGEEKCVIKIAVLGVLMIVLGQMSIL